MAEAGAMKATIGRRTLRGSLVVGLVGLFMAPALLLAGPGWADAVPPCDAAAAAADFGPAWVDDSGDPMWRPQIWTVANDPDGNPAPWPADCSIDLGLADGSHAVAVIGENSAGSYDGWGWHVGTVYLVLHSKPVSSVPAADLSAFDSWTYSGDVAGAGAGSGPATVGEALGNGLTGAQTGALAVGLAAVLLGLALFGGPEALRVGKRMYARARG